jgi:hypothetical protein
MGTAVAPREFKNFINGEWVASASGGAIENRNPGFAVSRRRSTTDGAAAKW